MNAKELDLLAFELANMRLQADLKLAPKYPNFANKPYPLGRCLEIRDEMFRLVTQSLSGDTEQLAVLRHYMRSSKCKLKKVWGSLRDEYFQNAMVVGDWYIDTANDTVHANKPRVEIKRLAESGFSAITSFAQFIDIAKPYWQVEVYKKTVFPALAPYLPLICVNHHGATWLAAANNDMIALATQSEFHQSQQVLATLAAPPPQVVRRWQQALAAIAAPDELLQQGGNPEDYCQTYKEANKASNMAFRDKVVLAYMSLPKSI